MQHRAFKFPFSFPALGENRYIHKFKIKLSKEVTHIYRCGVILSAFYDENPFTSPVHFSLCVGNKKVPAGNIMFSESGTTPYMCITLTELNLDIYPAGQYINGYFEITRYETNNLYPTSGTFTLILKTD
jgi:hypothetical protein